MRLIHFGALSLSFSFMLGLFISSPQMALADASTYATIVTNKDGTQTYTFNHLDALESVSDTPGACDFSDEYDEGTSDEFGIGISALGGTCSVTPTSFTGNVNTSSQSGPIPVSDEFAFNFYLASGTILRNVTRVEFDAFYGPNTAFPPLIINGKVSLSVFNSQGVGSLVTVLSGGSGGHVAYAVPPGSSVDEIIANDFGDVPVTISNIVITFADAPVTVIFVNPPQLTDVIAQATNLSPDLSSISTSTGIPLTNANAPLNSPSTVCVVCALVGEPVNTATGTMVAPASGTRRPNLQPRP